jgi:hypothetical protein
MIKNRQISEINPCLPWKAISQQIMQDSVILMGHVSTEKIMLSGYARPRYKPDTPQHVPSEDHL